MEWGSIFFLLVALLVGGGFLFVWYKTHEAASAADKWFGLVHHAQFEEAYRLASPAFQEAISLQLFRERAELVGLTRGKPSVWSQREISREAVKMATGILGEKGTTPLTVQLRLIDGQWRMHAVRVTPMVGREMRRLMDIKAEEPGLIVEDKMP